MRTALVAGNWKMNGSRSQTEQLIAGLLEGYATAGSAIQGSAELAVFPPALYLDQVQNSLSGSDISWGAQNASEHESGAYTGELAASMLMEFGCKYVILGHSERRALFGETNSQIAAKFAAAKLAGLIPILCVGETLEQRQANETLAVVAAQVAAIQNHLGEQAFEQAVIAYEPVWAIGTGLTATPEQAQTVHAAIRAQVAAVNPAAAQALQILYGGSVNASNAQTLFAMTDIDGGLVGGASLKADDFLTIYQAAG